MLSVQAKKEEEREEEKKQEEAEECYQGVSGETGDNPLHTRGGQGTRVQNTQLEGQLSLTVI